MNEIVFISGSISIRKLPLAVKKSIDKIIKNDFKILVGDANGIDRLVQQYCANKDYFNVVVYSILEHPRNLASDKFEFKKIAVDENIKSGFLRQQQKDIAMTIDSDYSFVIWDGKSKGSYANILRALSYGKKIKVFLTTLNEFLKTNEINETSIEHIFRANNGYSAMEVIDYLRKNALNYFGKSQDLYKFLLDKSMLRYENKSYKPLDKNSELFIIETYKGRPNGVKFSAAFLSWIQNELQRTFLDKKYGQTNLSQNVVK